MIDAQARNAFDIGANCCHSIDMLYLFVFSWPGIFFSSDACFGTDAGFTAGAGFVPDFSGVAGTEAGGAFSGSCFDAATVCCFDPVSADGVSTGLFFLNNENKPPCFFSSAIVTPRIRFVIDHCI